jgi:hypothetical protein
MPGRELVAMGSDDVRLMGEADGFLGKDIVAADKEC